MYISWLVHFLVDTFPGWYFSWLVLFPVGTFPSWYISRLAHFPVGTFPGWHIPRLAHFPVGTFLGWYSRSTGCASFQHPRPTCLHCTPILWPTHLYHTPCLGPLVSIVPDLLLFIISYIVHSYTTIYTIYPWPIPFPWVHTTPSAHSYFMVQLLPWAHMGWPVPIATLSRSAARLRWVNSLNGLNFACIPRSLSITEPKGMKFQDHDSINIVTE